MYINYLIVEELLKQQQKELFDQARTGSLLRKDRAGPINRFDFMANYTRLRELINPSQKQPEKQIMDCDPSPECQVC